MEKQIKISFYVITLIGVMFSFQNCTEFSFQNNEIQTSINQTQQKNIKTNPIKDEDDITAAPNDQVLLYGNPMALFVNCGTHYDASKQNMIDLNPGFIRVFVNDWHRPIAIRRAYKCMEELDSENRIFLLQFTKIYKNDNLEDFEEVLHYFNNKFGDKIRYWQLGNEYDHDNSTNFPVGVGEVEDFVERLNHLESFLIENNPKAKLTLSLTSKVFDNEKPDRLEKFEAFRKALTRKYSGDTLSLDIHYHHDFKDAENIVVPIKRLLNRFQTYKPNFILTENNTHSGQAIRRDSEGNIIKSLHFQTEEMQASYGLRTVALALSKGAQYTTFGYPIDRPHFGNPLWGDHHFALNGLFYNPDKLYENGLVKDGPKRSAYAYWLLSQLFERQERNYPESPLVVTSNFDGQTGLYIVSFKPKQGQGKGFQLIWFKQYDNDDQFKSYELNIDPSTQAVFNASKVGQRVGWPPASLNRFVDAFDMTNRRGAFKNLKIKKSDTFIVIDR